MTTRSHQFAYFDEQLGGPDWASSNVLDFGGNVGGILLDERCTIDPAKYWCVDVSKYAVDIGSAAHPDSHFTWYDRYNFEYNPGGDPWLPVPDLGRRFDIVLAYSVFTHTSQLEMLTLVDQLRSMVASGGVLAFTFLDPGFGAWAREDELPGLTNLEWRLTKSLGAGPRVDSMVAEAMRQSPSWLTLVNHEELVLDGGMEWVRRGDERSQYITFCTERHMREIYPDAVVLPPVRPQRHSCCVITT